MDKQGIYKYLKEKAIDYEVTEHVAVYDMAELVGIHLPYPNSMAKNLFIRDDKKRNFYLITVKGDKRIDLKEFRSEYNTRSLSFASEAYLDEIMNLSPGSVTPFGILNDDNCRVKLFLDKDFFDSPTRIGIHPNDNTATIWLDVHDLVKIIRNHGNEVQIIRIE